MSTKLRVGVVLALLTVASVTVATATSFGDDDDDSSRSGALRLVAKEVAFTDVDLGDNGFSQGDQVAFTNDLLSNGTKVGEDGGVCTAVRLTDVSATFQCNGTNALPGGQIAVQGLVTYGPGDEELKQDPYSFAITGGTGKYRAARGEVVIQDVASDEFHLTFRIHGTG
jgi:hypothetical protein